MKKKVMVAHFGKQHSYRLATALRKNDTLHKYVTTVYLKKGNWTGIVKRFLRGSNLNRVTTRRMSNVEDKYIKQFCELGGLINLILIRIDKSKKIYMKWSRFVARRFAKKLAKYVIAENPDMLIMYDTNAKYTFEILEKKAPHIKRVLDVSSASHRFMKQIYIKDIESNPKYASILSKETEYFWSDQVLERYEREIELSHFFLVPSEFVIKSLEYHGVPRSKMKLCPYGSESNLIKTLDFNKNTQPLKCIYVGSLSQRKGISYLLEAFEDYDKDKVELTLVGAYDNSEGIFNEYFEKYNFAGFVTKKEVENLLLSANIMIFPSLSEGMSLAVLEGLSYGLPVICTENSGYSGIVVDEYNGFVINPGDTDSIKEKINWFLNNKEKLPEISHNARETAKKYTWEKYEETAGRIINEILEE